MFLKKILKKRKLKKNKKMAQAILKDMVILIIAFSFFGTGIL